MFVKEKRKITSSIKLFWNRYLTKKQPTNFGYVELKEQTSISIAIYKEAKFQSTHLIYVRQRRI